MVASSVTGRGLGSASGKQKGSEHMTLGVANLIGPRIMAADEVTLDGSGDAVVVLPLFPGVVGDYTVSATDTHAAAANAVAAALTFNANDTTVTIKGSNGQTVSYVIVKKGLAL